MKKSIYVFGLLSLLFLVFSCAKKDTTAQEVISEEAVITNFYLYSDSIKDIDDYVFTIDNDKKLIYNYDSIAYGTMIDSLAFIINPKFSAVYINDSIVYKSSAVYLDFNKDVKITVVAADEKTSADYYVEVNVHKVDPDTFVWKCVSSDVFVGEALSAKSVYFGEKLIYMAVVNNRLVAYESVDGVVWKEIGISGVDVDLMDLDLNCLVATEDYLYIYAAKKLYRSTDVAAWTLINTSGTEIDHLLFGMDNGVYAVTVGGNLAHLDGLEWVDLGGLPAKFPVEGSAVLVAAAPSGKERVFVVGGIDEEGNYLSSVWSSEDGVYWSEMTSGIEKFTPRAFAAVAQYGDGLMLFGGKGKSGEVVKDAQLYSKDFGLNWGEPKTKSVIDSLYVPRYEHSVVVTPAGYIYLIGGRASEGATINDVWRGMNYASLPGFRR